MKKTILIAILLYMCSLNIATGPDFSQEQKQIMPLDADYTTETTANLGFLYNTTELSKAYMAGTTKIYFGNMNYYYEQTPALDGNTLTQSQTQISLFNITRRQYAIFYDVSNQISPTTYTKKWITTDDTTYNPENSIRQDDPRTSDYPTNNFLIYISMYLTPKTYSETDILEVNLTIDYYNNGYNTDSFLVPFSSKSVQNNGTTDLLEVIYSMNVDNGDITWDYLYPLIIYDNANLTLKINFNPARKPDFLWITELDISTQYKIQASDINLCIDDDYYFVDTGYNSAILNTDSLAYFPDSFYFHSDMDGFSWYGGYAPLYFRAIFTTYYTETITLTIQSSTFLTGTYQLTKEDFTLTFYHFGYADSVDSIYINSQKYEYNDITLSTDITQTTYYIEIGIILDIESPIASPLQLISSEQISNGTTNQNITFRYIFKATMTNYYWSFVIPHNINTIITNTTNPPELLNGVYYIDQILTNNKYIEVNATIDPNYIIDYSIIAETNQYTNITLSYSADLLVENITLLIELSRFYKNWDMGTQNYNKIYSIANITFTNTTQTLDIYGEMANPTLVNFWYYDFNRETIFTQDFSDEIEFHAYIEFPDSNFAFELPIQEDWTLDGVHYGSNDYNIDENNVFYAEFNQNIRTCYLQFFTNPINSFDISISEDYITLKIDVQFPLEYAIFLFYVQIDESYKIRDDRVLDLGEYNDADYYSIILSLDDGMNTIMIELQRYKTSRTGTYVILFLGVLAFVGLWYYQKRREAKIDNDSQ